MLPVQVLVLGRTASLLGVNVNYILSSQCNIMLFLFYETLTKFKNKSFVETVEYVVENKIPIEIQTLELQSPNRTFI